VPPFEPGLIIVELRAGQACTYVPGSSYKGAVDFGAGLPETSIMLFSGDFFAVKVISSSWNRKPFISAIDV
jgi:hypothetical protein